MRGARSCIARQTTPLLIALLLALCAAQLGAAMATVTKLQPQLRTMQRAAKQEFVNHQLQAHRASGCLVFSKTY
jgi:hypothetical protein